MMTAYFLKRRGSASISVLLSLGVLTGTGWLCFVSQKAGELKSNTTKATAQQPNQKPTGRERSDAKKPVTEKPTTEKPTTEKSAVQKPVTPKSGREKSTGGKSGEKPVAEKSVTQTAVPLTAPAARSAIEKLHPAKPVFLYFWDGYAAHRRTWEATAFHQSFVSTGISKALEKLFFLAFQEESSTGASAVQMALQTLMRCLNGGASLSVSIETGSDGPAPHITFVLHGAAGFEKNFAGIFTDPVVETISERQVTRVAIPDFDGYEFGWWTEGEHLVLAGGLKGLEAAIEVAAGKLPNLSSHPAYQKLRVSPDFDVASIQLVDLQALSNLVRDLDVPPLPGSSKPALKIGDLLAVAGVHQLGLLSSRWGFRGEALWTETDLEVPAPLAGVMQLYDQKPLTLDALPALPRQCECFLFARYDVSKSVANFVSTAESIAQKMAPDDAPTIADTLKIVDDSLGISLQKDLTEALGDTLAFYIESSGLYPAGVVLISLDDAKKVEASLGKLQERLKELDPSSEIEIRTKPVSGRTLHIFQHKQMPILYPTWVIDQNWLVVGTTPQAIEAYLKRVDGKLPRWKPEMEHQAALKMLPEKFTTFYYADPRNLLKYGLGLAPTGIAMLKERFDSRPRRDASEGKPQDGEFPLTPEDIPNGDEVTASLFPNFGACAVDATGIHWRNRNSLPGLPVPGIPGGSSGVDGTLIVPFSLFFVGARSVRLEQPVQVLDAVPAN